MDWPKFHRAPGSRDLAAKYGKRVLFFFRGCANRQETGRFVNSDELAVGVKDFQVGEFAAGPCCHCTNLHVITSLEQEVMPCDKLTIDGHAPQSQPLFDFVASPAVKSIRQKRQKTDRLEHS